ncbi:hypothetical protein, partial [Salmonella enterica]|uniref:hypothetical protein n=1 Tax=Salmonella enterica TaxID=28901 RepID=UPI0032977605
ANAKALEAAGIAAGKGRVYTQPDPPGPDANGLWIDTDNGNLPHRWDGTNNVWVPVRDTGIQDAANAAAAAQ